MRQLNNYFNLDNNIKIYIPSTIDTDKKINTKNNPNLSNATLNVIDSFFKDQTMGSTIATILLTIITTVLGFALFNLLKKNETLEDFITKQSDAVNECDKRLKEIDSKGIFYADDEIGWFFKEIKKIQEALNEFTLK